MDRHRVSYMPMMMGGRIVKVKHIGGKVVELKKTAHNRKEYCCVSGRGTFDINSPQSNMITNNIRRMPIPVSMSAGGSIKGTASKERILREIANSMKGRKRH